MGSYDFYFAQAEGEYYDTLTCPKCGKMSLQTETKYGTRNTCCGLWSWGFAPLVDAETHEARKKAHSSFDVLWKKGLYDRSEAYSLLADELEIDEDDCHMKLMDKETASKVPMIALLLKHKRRYNDN